MNDSYNLLCVCTGNICRSPMAEAFARQFAHKRDWPISVRSGGTLGLIGRQADPLAIRVMNEVGIDISAHRSGGIDEEQVKWADYILVMELNHQIQLHRKFEASDGKVLMLGTFGGLHEIADPIGGWRWKFRSIRDEIERCIAGFFDHLPPPQTSDPTVQ